MEQPRHLPSLQPPRAGVGFRGGKEGDGRRRQKRRAKQEREGEGTTTTWPLAAPAELNLFASRSKERLLACDPPQLHSVCFIQVGFGSQQNPFPVLAAAFTLTHPHRLATWMEPTESLIGAVNLNLVTSINIKRFFKLMCLILNGVLLFKVA